MYATLWSVCFAKRLDDQPRPAETAAERMRVAFEMFEEGVAMQHLNLRRAHPDAPEAEIEQKLQRWLAREVA